MSKRFFVKYSDGLVPYAASVDDTTPEESVETLLKTGWEEVSEEVYAVAVQTIHSSSVPVNTTIEELAEENKLLKAQLQAQSDRSDFIEDCIAEMAIQVYGGV